MWVVCLGADGRELGRTAVSGAAWLRAAVAEALALGAAGVILVREAGDDRCEVDSDEVERVRAILQPLGLRLHDYLVFWGNRCISLRLAGRL